MPRIWPSGQSVFPWGRETTIYHSRSRLFGKDIKGSGFTFNSMKIAWSKVRHWCLYPMRGGDRSPLWMRECRGILRVSRSSGQLSLPWHMWWKPLLGGGLFPWSSGMQPTPRKGSLTRTWNRLKVKTFILNMAHVWELLFMTFHF